MEPALDNQPHMSSEEAVAIVEADLGRPISEVFATFDPVPTAAASIGQVHRATLKEDGRRVVVKVMYPGVSGGHGHESRQGTHGDWWQTRHTTTSTASTADAVD